MVRSPDAAGPRSGRGALNGALRASDLEMIR
jgi:hypothetical protein